MLDRPSHPSWLAEAFSWFLLVLAIGGYVLFGWSFYLLHIIPTAPQACAQETSHSSGTTPPEELFVGITSAVGHHGLLHGTQIPTDANSAICVIRASDGAILRHYALGENTSIPVLIQADGVLYYVLTGTDISSQLCAMQASSGHKLWCQTIAFNENPSFLGPPLILAHQTLYLLASDGASYELHAIRASDGTPLWEHPAAASSFAITNGAAYLFSSLTQVCALQATDGATLWCSSATASIRITGLAADSMGVYTLDEQGTVVAYQPADGSVLWQHALGHPSINTFRVSYSPLLLQDGILFVTTSDSSTILTALQNSDGTPLWDYSASTLAAATVQNGIVYLGNQNSLLALQAANGQQLWQQPLPQISQYSLVPGNSFLYLLDRAGNLSAFNKSDGSPLWTHTQCADTGTSPGQQLNGARIWCGWGTEVPYLGPNWWAQSNVSTQSGSIPGAVAPVP
jgi:outer membrane protein assembly factor BamB